MTYLHHETPLIDSPILSSLHQGNVFLKMESSQPCHSFKIRGVGLLCQNAFNSGIRKFVSSSGGNAGLATAYASRKLGAEVKIFVPVTTSLEVIARLKLEGAEVIVRGQFWDEAHQHAIQEAESTQAKLVHPFDDPELWQGHSSLIKEVHAKNVTPDAVLLSVGGGGLLCGVLEGLHSVGWSHIPVIAVETEGADSFAQSYKAKKIIELEKIQSLATSLGARKVATTAFQWLSKHDIRPVTVSDKLAVNACISFSNDHKVIVEPACGVVLSTIYNRHPALAGFKNLLVVVCGGIGASIDKLISWQQMHH
ncbi:MAG: pyridoxal-phosphate dependent enzyme [Pseudobdellovibrionaceae bacterium]